jgi:hypothetical protein
VTSCNRDWAVVAGFEIDLLSELQDIDRARSPLMSLVANEL